MATKKKPDRDRNPPVVIADDGGRPPGNRRFGTYIYTKYDWDGLAQDGAAQVALVVGTAISSGEFNDGHGPQPIPGLDNFSVESDDQKRWIRGYYDQGTRIFVIAASDKMQKFQDPNDANYFYFFWRPSVKMGLACLHGNSANKTVGPGTLKFELG